MTIQKVIISRRFLDLLSKLCPKGHRILICGCASFRDDPPHENCRHYPQQSQDEVAYCHSVSSVLLCIALFFYQFSLLEPSYENSFQLFSLFNF